MSPLIKKKEEGIKIPSRYVLLLIVIGCTVLIVVTYTTPTISEPVSRALGFVITPFERGISSAGSYFSALGVRFKNLTELQDENAILQSEVDRLTIENTELQQNRYELSALQKLYDIDAQYEDYETTGARVIARDSGNWFYSFVIDKGAEDGIQKDMNVMAGSGLAGRVTQVGSTWARVKAIIADDSNVSAMVLSNSAQMIVSGDLEKYREGVITFSQLMDSEDAAKVGDKVVTSNISEKFLPGILIGYIDSIELDSNNLTKSGTITPAVNFTQMNEVLVILRMKSDAAGYNYPDTE